MDVTGGNIRDEENMALSVSTAAGQSGAEREVARERMTALRNEIERLRRQLSHLEIEQEQQKHGEHLYVPDSDGSNDVYHEIPAMSFVRNNKCDAASSVENKNIDDRMNIHLQSAAHRHKNINHFNNNMTFYQSLSDRSSWLVALLIFQSCSSFILSHNDALLARHPTIVHFLTMLVGAGGNAGNQASVRGTC